MEEQTVPLNVLVERQLELESGIADALESLNAEMAALLDNSGIYGPKRGDLDGLSPLVETLRQRYAASRVSRETLTRFAWPQKNSETECEADAKTASVEPPSLKKLLQSMPSSESNRLDEVRKRIHNRLRDAQQKLTANQVVIFYSTEFHRRYLLGVLQCDVDEANYHADGQSFKLSPEKIIGRNC
ncbi:MAG: hypothetical protein KDB00_18555 [Planctomycetales bacterium]|nr:hypothetical protein [Planctomycetales bacterium]